MSSLHDRDKKIFVEDARILRKKTFADAQVILRLALPQCAQHARAGQFVFVQCAKELLMRRPYSIMQADAAAGWIDLYFRVTGQGSRLLAQHQENDCLSVMGPIGHPFAPQRTRPRTLLLGGGVGMPPVLFLAQQLQNDSFDWQPLVFLASERPYPFSSCSSAYSEGALQEIPATATLQQLEQAGIPARLCSLIPLEGCFKGRIDELVRQWLDKLSLAEKSQTEIFACGPEAMLKAIARLAKQHEIFCQLCVEEYMACATGGCAGCAVKLIKDDQIKMSRVCVDGPVFYAHELYG